MHLGALLVVLLRVVLQAAATDRGLTISLANGRFQLRRRRRTDQSVAQARTSVRFRNSGVVELTLVVVGNAVHPANRQVVSRAVTPERFADSGILDAHATTLGLACVAVGHAIEAADRDEQVRTGPHLADSRLECREAGPLREAGIVIGNDVIPADRGKNLGTVVRVAWTFVLYRYALCVCFAAIDETTAVHAADGPFNGRTAVRRTSAKPGYLRLGLEGETLVDVGVTVNAADGIECLRAAARRFRTNAGAGDYHACRLCNTFVAVGLTVIATDRVVLHGAGHIITLRQANARVRVRNRGVRIDIGRNSRRSQQQAEENQ